MRTLIAIAIVGILAGGTAALSAHEEFRVIGTISKHQGAVINVEGVGFGERSRAGLA